MSIYFNNVLNKAQRSFISWGADLKTLPLNWHALAARCAGIRSGLGACTRAPWSNDFGQVCARQPRRKPVEADPYCVCSIPRWCQVSNRRRAGASWRYPLLLQRDAAAAECDI